MSSDGEKKIYFLLAKEISNSRGTAKVLEALAEISLGEKEEVTVVKETKAREDVPVDFVTIAKFFRAAQKTRQSLNQVYEESMAKYSKVNAMTTGKRRPTEDEVKLKQTLMDYILKAEGIFERNDLVDESLIKELNRFFESLDSAEKLSEANIFSLYISPKTAGLIYPLLDKMRDCYQEYGKLQPTLKRLNRIADFIIEDAGT
ncbi:hypothetical protein EHO60_00610 [Leptospira fletcheri]|uniref:Uncharacterized protein n=1 Tax=Leptospira fletcheri TaxID=2484981 RepID=A0A4R9GJZ1_9LEPT|nr:hypothetical protein [Leptospira fletcheri]TGK13889.1 hypothetical protein EHO60_00610 [Leptospira fletcheri]